MSGNISLPQADNHNQGGTYVEIETIDSQSCSAFTATRSNITKYWSCNHQSLQQLL